MVEMNSCVFLLNTITDIYLTLNMFNMTRFEKILMAREWLKVSTCFIFLPEHTESQALTLATHKQGSC